MNSSHDVMVPLVAPVASTAEAGAHAHQNEQRDEEPGVPVGRLALLVFLTATSLAVAAFLVAGTRPVVGIAA